MESDGSQRFDMNRAFFEAQGIFGESAGLFAGLALVFAIPGAIAELSIKDGGDATSLMVALVVGSLFGAVSEGAITLGALRRIKGEPLGGDLLGTALDHYLPILVALLVGSMAALLGFYLLVLPGIIVMAFLFFAIPAIVEEDARGARGGIAGLERSVTLGAGQRFEIILMVFIFIVVLLAVNLMLDFLLGAAPLLAAFANWAAGSVVSAFGTILAVTSYAQLRALNGKPLAQDTTPRPQ